MLARSEVLEGSSLHLSLSLHLYSQHFTPQTFNTQGSSVAGGAGCGHDAGKECSAEGVMTKLLSLEKVSHRLLSGGPEGMRP